VLQRAAARLAAACLVASLDTKRRQIAQIGVREQDDVASRSAIATVGTTLRNVLLTAEVKTPVATAARLDADLSSIVEHDRTLAPRWVR
jgi:hypothetical protein